MIKKNYSHSLFRKFLTDETVLVARGKKDVINFTARNAKMSKQDEILVRGKFLRTSFRDGIPNEILFPIVPPNPILVDLGTQ